MGLRCDARTADGRIRRGGVMIRDGGGVGMVKVIGVSRDQVDESLGWWAWCGQCMEPVGPAYHPTWREAMAAAAAHADHHRRENAATEYGLLA